MVGLKRETIRAITIKSMSIMLVAVLMVSSVTYASGVERKIIAPESGGQIQVYLKPDVTIIVRGTERIFRDVNNEIVFPIIYNGSTYLPVRAVSGIMEEDIEWDGENKIIFMGRTFANPNKLNYKPADPKEESSTSLSGGVGIIDFVKPNPAMISAYLRPNFLIAYDFEFQVFKDERGNPVYPIVVNGSTYLPIRAVSQIMKDTIDWDGINKVITIGSPDVPVVEKSVATKALIAQFEKQLTLYDSATVKIKNLQKATSLEDLNILSSEVSKDYLLAAENLLTVKAMDTGSYTRSELNAYAGLVEFTQISEQYILVLENIAYMAAAEQDYIMLVDTFVGIATQAENKLAEARELMELL